MKENMKEKKKKRNNIADKKHEDIDKQTKTAKRSSHFMFDKLDDILMRLEEVLNQLSEPDVAADAAKFQKLMKEQAELQPIADAYKDYKTQKQTIEESLMLLEEESDEEMREMLKEELSDAKKRVEELEQELKVLLLPKDPNDVKNVIV